MRKKIDMLFNNFRHCGIFLFSFLKKRKISVISTRRNCCFSFSEEFMNVRLIKNIINKKHKTKGGLPYLLLLVFLFNFNFSSAQRNMFDSGELDTTEAGRKSLDEKISEEREKFNTLIDQLLDVEMLKKSYETRRVGKNRSVSDSLEYYYNEIGINFMTIARMDIDELWARSFTSKKAYSTTGKVDTSSLSSARGRNIFFRLTVDSTTSMNEFKIYSSMTFNEPLNILLSNYGISGLESQINDYLKTNLNNKKVPRPAEYREPVKQAIQYAYDLIQGNLNPDAREELRELAIKDGTVEENFNSARKDFQVAFTPLADNKYGFDKYTQIYGSTWKESYQFSILGDGEEYSIPYQSTIKDDGQLEVIATFVHTPADSVKYYELTFEDANGQINDGLIDSIGVDVNGNPQYKIQIPAGSDLNNHIYAFYNRKKIGKVNIRAYEQKTKHVIIVPVGAEISRSQEELSEELNKVYGQAGIHWTVKVEPVFDTEEAPLEEVLFHIPEKDGKILEADYSQEMKDLRRAYLDKYPQKLQLTNKPVIMFAVAGFEQGTVNSSNTGFMPRGRGMGFVTRASLEDGHTLAHEIGHGAFGLEHTWHDDGPAQSTTDNLMDYSTGTQLTCSQWASIHSKKIIFNYKDDSEDASNVEIRRTLLTNKLIELLKANTSNNKFELEESKKSQFTIYENTARTWAQFSSGSKDYSVSRYEFKYDEYFDVSKPQLEILNNGINTIIEVFYTNDENEKILQIQFNFGFHLEAFLKEIGQKHLVAQCFPLYESAIETGLTEYRTTSDKSNAVYHLSEYLDLGQDYLERLSYDTRIDLCKMAVDLSSGFARAKSRLPWFFSTITSNEEVNSLVNRQDFKDWNKVIQLYTEDYLIPYSSIKNSDLPFYRLLVQINRIANQYYSTNNIENHSQLYPQNKVGLPKGIVSYRANKFNLKYTTSTRNNTRSTTYTFSPWEAVALTTDNINPISLYNKDDLEKQLIKTLIPGINLAFNALIAREKREQQQLDIAFDLTLMAVGAMEFRVASATFKGGARVLGTARYLLALADLVTGVTSMACRSNDSELCADWKSIEALVNLGLISASTLDALPSLIRRTKPYDTHKILDGFDDQGFKKADGLAKAGSKVNLLGKLDNLTSLKTWVNGLDDVADANLITKLDGLDVGDLVKLEADIASNSMGSGLKALLKESPDDLNDMWKLLKDDPKYAFELSKTGGSRWEKWAQGNFFKTVTKAGKDFEQFVSSNLSVLRTKLLSKYPNIDLNDYAIFEQIQMKTGQKLASGADEFFIADFVLVKKKTVLGQEILDFDNAIVLETKLSSGTALTGPQTNALTKAKTSSNTFDVRTVSQSSTTNSSYSLGSSTSNKTVTVTDYIKVNSNGVGGTIQDVNSLK